MLHLRTTGAYYAIKAFTSLMGFCCATKESMSDSKIDFKSTAGASHTRNDMNNKCYVCHGTLDLTIPIRKTLSDNTAFKLASYKCTNSECNRSFHRSCLVNAWYEVGKCPNCDVKCQNGSVFQPIIEELGNLITFTATLSQDEIDEEAFLNYFSRFDSKPVEFLYSIFAGAKVSLYKMTLFKDRIAHFNELKGSETVNKIILVLEKFIEGCKCFFQGIPYQESDDDVNLLILLSFSDRLFDLEFTERSIHMYLPEKLCQKLKAASRVMKYINSYDNKIKQVYNSLSYSPLKSLKYEHSLKKPHRDLNAATRLMNYINIGKEKPRHVRNPLRSSLSNPIKYESLSLPQGDISNMMPHDMYFSIWNFEFNPTRKLVRMAIGYE